MKRIRLYAGVVAFAVIGVVSAQGNPPEPAAEEVKVPEGVDPKMTSDDPDYGYSEEKPVKVGGRTITDGPKAEREYLEGLRDEAGKRVEFRRIGNFGPGPDGNLLDAYEVTTSTGRKLRIFIDMYHLKTDPKKQLAPHGLFKAK
jgi:hypothetical protein